MRAAVTSSRGLLAAAALLISALLTALVVAWPLLRPDQYQALAAGIQALVVVVALLVALVTLLSDSRDKRIDRVIALNESLMGPDVWPARQRIARHLWYHGPDRDAGRMREVSLSDLDNIALLSQYGAAYESEHSKFRPREDARILLRFFERANSARIGGAVDEALFHELIGRHAVWVALAFSKDRASYVAVVEPLYELSDWANDYQERHQNSTRTYMKRWGESRIRGFGRLR